MKIEDTYKKIIEVVTSNQNSKIHNMVRATLLKVVDGETYIQSVEFYLKKAIRWDGNLYQTIQTSFRRGEEIFQGEWDQVEVIIFNEQDNRLPTKKYIFK